MYDTSYESTQTDVVCGGDCRLPFGADDNHYSEYFCIEQPCCVRYLVLYSKKRCYRYMRQAQRLLYSEYHVFAGYETPYVSTRPLLLNSSCEKNSRATHKTGS